MVLASTERTGLPFGAVGIGMNTSGGIDLSRSVVPSLKSAVCVHSRALGVHAHPACSAHGGCRVSNEG